MPEKCLDFKLAILVHVHAVANKGVGGIRKAAGGRGHRPAADGLAGTQLASRVISSGNQAHESYRNPMARVTDQCSASIQRLSSLFLSQRAAV